MGMFDFVFGLMDFLGSEPRMWRCLLFDFADCKWRDRILGEPLNLRLHILLHDGGKRRPGQENKQTFA